MQAYQSYLKLRSAEVDSMEKHYRTLKLPSVDIGREGENNVPAVGGTLYRIDKLVLGTAGSDLHVMGALAVNNRLSAITELIDSMSSAKMLDCIEKCRKRYNK